MSPDLDHHHADLGDIRLHYVTAGAGDLVVLLHGWPQTWYEWRHVIPHLADRYQVVAPDLRGLGDSSRSHAGFDKRTLADDIWRLVHDHLGHERFHLVGHDWGSSVAYALAAAHPDAVRRLALVEAYVPSDANIRLDSMVASVPVSAWPERASSTWHGRFHLVPDLPEALVQGRERIYLSWFLRNFAHTSYELPEEDLEEYVRTYSDPAALHAGFELYRTVAQDAADNTALGRRLSMPVLVIQGRGPVQAHPDLPWRQEGEAEALRWTATDIEEVLIDDAGHWIPEEQPEVLAEHLVAFLAASQEGSTAPTGG